MIKEGKKEISILEKKDEVGCGEGNELSMFVKSGERQRGDWLKVECEIKERKESGGSGPWRNQENS